MYVNLTCVVVDADNANRQEMTAFLMRHGVTVAAALSLVDQLPQILGRQESPQLVVVNLDPNPSEVLHKLASLTRQYSNVSFFALSRVIDAQVVIEAMHVGVKEFIPLPINPEKFLAGVDRVASAVGTGRRATCINVIPTIGGCGATTVACNLAASFARSNAKTVLMDLDLVCGSVASSFDLRPRYTIADVMDSAERLDKQLLDNALAVHPATGLSILARPELPEEAQRVSQMGLTRLLGALGQYFSYMVIDSAMSVDPVYATAIHAADINIVVLQLNIPSARNAERIVGAMRRMGVDPMRIRIVINRYLKKGGDIEPEEVERVLGLKIHWTIPNDFKNAINAINYGEPVVLRSPKSDISTSLAKLRDSLNGRNAPEVAAK